MKKARRNVIIALISLVIIVLVGAVITAIKAGKISPQAATINAALSLSPASGTYATGTTFDVAIMVNTGGQAVDGVDINHLHYPAANMEIQTVTAGTAFTVSTVTKTGGTLNLVATVAPGSAGFNGTTTVATVNFKALTDTTAAALTFDFTLGSTIDCNVAEHGTGVDLLGSVTGATYVFRTAAVLNINLNLQQRTNHTTASSVFNVYTPGGATPVFTQNVNTSTTGAAQVSTLTLVPGTNYDYKIKANYFLSKKILNTALTNPITLNFGVLKGGDLDNNDLVNSLDFSVLNLKWLLSDAVADINADTLVNSLDFAIMNGNWLLGPQ